MSHIRKACLADLSRIAEMEVFNYRLKFYPIFQNDDFYFNAFQVQNRIRHFAEKLDQLWVYDDGAVKGFIQIQGRQIEKLFVEPVLQGKGIGADLLESALAQGADYLWALERNTRAIVFYEHHGFCVTTERMPEEDTDEYLVKLVRYDDQRN